MKADKLLFGAACMAMGIMTYSTMNKGNTEPFIRQPRICAHDSVKLKPTLMKDTLSFSNPDTLKLTKQLIKH